MGLADVDQAGAANAVLLAVDMVELARVEKARTTYRRPGADDTVVSVDVVTGVGALIETEVTGVDAAAAAEQLRCVEREVGASDYRAVRLPYRDLVMVALDRGRCSRGDSSAIRGRISGSLSGRAEIVCGLLIGSL